MCVLAQPAPVIPDSLNLGETAVVTAIAGQPQWSLFGISGALTTSAVKWQLVVGAKGNIMSTCPTAIKPHRYLRIWNDQCLGRAIIRFSGPAVLATQFPALCSICLLP